MEPRLSYIYDKRQVNIGLLVVQGFLLMILFALYKRPLDVNSSWLVPVLGVGFPLLIYLAFFAWILRIYFRRNLLSLYDDGTIIIKSIRNYRVKLPAGTVVNYSNRCLQLTTNLPKIWFARNKNGVVTLPMPKGLYPVGQGRFVIGEATTPIAV